MAPSNEPLTTVIKSAASYVVNAVEVLRFGGLQTDEETSPYEVVTRRPMFRLRRYFAPADGGAAEGRTPIILVPPTMLSAEVWDVSPATSGVAALHEAGMDPWVVDFGAPDREEGGLERTLTDHVVAVNEAIDLVVAETGRSIHLGGYSQGGLFCYQAAAFRRSKDLDSIVTFGSAVDMRSAAPFGVPEDLFVTFAGIFADYIVGEKSLPGWLSSAGFRALDPLKTARNQVRFLRQLHDRESLIGNERQRRFLAGEGFVTWSGPAIIDLLQQVVVQNRMMVGGFVIGDHVVSLADITCPILAMVGEVDDIGVPAGVRKIGAVAPAADVHEFQIRAGHFGLVVGSAATAQTWPTVIDWIEWIEDGTELPETVVPLGATPVDDPSPSNALMLAADGATNLAGFGVGAVRGAVGLAANTLQATRELSWEALLATPRLMRLGQIQSNTKVSFARSIAERAKTQPHDACFLFEDRVHTYEAVDTRITNVVKGLTEVGVHQGDHVGLLMETRPSALVAIAALSRLGAVAVLLPPSQDLPELLRLSSVSDVIVDPEHAAKVGDAGARALVLGGGGAARDLPTELGIEAADAVDLERIDPDEVELPAWYRPNPGIAADLAFVMFTRTKGMWQTRLVTNHRWALSAFGTASAARLTAASTVYCLTPLHHPSGLLTAVGGAVAGGSRIALSRGFDPVTFDEEIRRYGVTVVSYTWTMMRDLVRQPVSPKGSPTTIALFMGSGMPRGLWRRLSERYPAARVLEFYAATEFDVVLAHLSSTKPGSRGRPLPGTSTVRLVAVDPDDGSILTGPDGYALPAEEGEPGVLLTKPRLGIDASVRRLRGVFRRGDTWVTTDDVFLRDRDGDFWLLGPSSGVVHTARGPVYPQQIADALGDLPEVDQAVLYGVAVGDEQLSVAAVSKWGERGIKAADIGGTLSAVPIAQRPDIVHVVDTIPVTNWYRPDPTSLRAAGVPEAGPRAFLLNPETGEYLRLTKGARETLVAAADDDE